MIRLHYGMAVDILFLAFGVLLWEIVSLVGSLHSDVKPAKYKVLATGYILPLSESCPPAMYELMRQCLERVPDNRPSFKEVLSTLNNMDVNKGVYVFTHA